jgi:hypothetical protein
LWLLRDLLEIEPRGILLLTGLTTLAATLSALWRFPNYATSAAAWARSLIACASRGDRPAHDGSAAFEQDDIGPVRMPEQPRLRFLD